DNMAIKTYSRKKNGNLKLSANFKVKEFACKDGSDYILIDTVLVEFLQKIRDHFGKSVTINSAYRNATYNRKIGGVSNSQHVKGTAADIMVKGVKPEDVAKYAEYIMPDKGGIGLYGTFVHVDTRAKRSRWTNYGKEKSVAGFPGYVNPDVPESAKYYIEGSTHVIEIDPRNIWAVETQCKTNKVKYNNFVNSVFFMPQANGVMYPQGIMVNAGAVVCNNPTHGKPVATLIVHGADDVEMKYVSDITKEKNVWFAVSGFGIYPNITALEEGFTGKFTDVLRITNRPIIGYRKSDNKIVIAVRANTSATRAQQTAKNLKLDFAISLDAGGSTTLKVGGKYKFKGDGRKIYGGLIWN
ncbi:MAG: DUF882 domain-containing protein, partial [Clostridia bacterium]|nr:DUF882 domain-containing protein [Clostridia bacterium]